MIVLPEEWMAGFDGILTVGSVTQMPQKQFSQIGELGLKILGLTQEILGPYPGIAIISVDALKNIFERLSGNGPGTADVTTSRWNIKLDGGHACPVLTTVMLLLHQEVQLLQSVIRRAVMPVVIR